jgi:hypothetical protein
MISEFACSAATKTDGLAHVRSPHFIDLVGDDGSVVRLLLVAPDAMGREHAILSHHPAHAARARANPGNAQSRPWFATTFAVKVGRFDFPADVIGQVSIRTRACRTGATGDRRRWRSLEKAIHAGARDTPRARDPRQTITTRRGRRDRLAHRLDLLRAGPANAKKSRKSARRSRPAAWSGSMITRKPLDCAEAPTGLC